MGHSGAIHRKPANNRLVFMIISRIKMKKVLPLSSSPLSIIIMLLMIICTNLCPVTSIKCFNCKSNLDEKCLEIEKYNLNETAHLQQECNLEDYASFEFRPTREEELFCQVVRLQIMHSKHYRVIRKCAFLRTKRKMLDNFYHIREIEECFTDLCNSSNRVTMNWIILLLSFMIYVKIH
uniref:CSON005623 protein n=1 Tax=Culicoides sonorensis TaxID=179676 RepID=A0A336LVD7_CULSO